MPDQASYQQKLKERKERQKELEKVVEASVNAVVDSVEIPQLHDHLFYGAMGISPVHLVTWYIFKLDNDLKEARQNGLVGQIESRTREELMQRGYPKEFVPRIHVSFTTYEDIQRETGGNYFKYFK